MTVPPALAARIAYDPPLPASRDQLTQKTPMGSVIKVMAAYDDAFWRADGLTGQAASDVGPVRITFDNSPPSGTPGVLLTVIKQPHADARVVSVEVEAALGEAWARASHAQHVYSMVLAPRRALP